MIRVRGVTKVYRQGEVEVRALRGVDLDVGQGGFTSLAGPSGSGKTTLLNLIGALDTPTSGTVELAGTDVSGLSRGDAAEFRLEHVGFVFQAYNLVPVLTRVRERRVHPPAAGAWAPGSGGRWWSHSWSAWGWAT